MHEVRKSFGANEVLKGFSLEIREGETLSIIGGSGFLGRKIVRRIAKTGARIRVAVRHPNEALFLKPMGDVGQILPIQANVRFPDSVARAVDARSAGRAPRGGRLPRRVRQGKA